MSPIKNYPMSLTWHNCDTDTLQLKKICEKSQLAKVKNRGGDGLR